MTGKMKLLAGKLGRKIEELSRLRIRDTRSIIDVDIREAFSREELVSAETRRGRSGESWGGRDRYAEFSFSLDVPVGSPCRLRCDLGEGHELFGPEGLVMVDEHPAHALDKYHREVPLKAGEHTIRIEAWSGLGDEPHLYMPPRLLLVDEETEGLYFDGLCCLEAALTLPEDDKRRIDLLYALDEALGRIDFRKPGTDEFYLSVIEARRSLSNPLPGDAFAEVSAFGHCHIDLAWLWRVRHTREKAVRSFSTALSLLERYPNFVFSQGQAQLYAWLPKDRPDMFREVLERVNEGRWEITGSAWVECDCNLTGGESLVRQLLYGKRYFREKFGVETKVAWFPDTFGFNANLPQIFRRCGIEVFITSKLSWNQFNPFPHDTFWWEGIDGTEVLAHFITTPPNSPDLPYFTYNGILEAEKVAGTWANYRQKGHNTALVFPFGYGDGGGGPTMEMLEKGQRLPRFPFLPRVRFEGVEKFAHTLVDISKNTDFPRYRGELYLEYHRGTYTTQGWIKMLNRQSEILYHEAEIAASLALREGMEYPAKELEEGWKEVLFHQFHDILTGSSIAGVYEDARAAYRHILENGQKMRERAMRFIAGRMRAEKGSICLFNFLAHTREEPLGLPGGILSDFECSLVQGEKTCDTQQSEDGKLLVSGVSVPPCGCTVLRRGKKRKQKTSRLRVEEQLLENEYFRVILDNDGLICSLFDKRLERECIAPGETANLFQAFEDLPIAHDAWDIDRYYQDKRWDITDLSRIAVTEAGPVRGTLVLERRFGRSTIIQRVRIWRDFDRLDFVTEIDWQERNTLLKVAFPFSLRPQFASCEIPWGYLLRPTSPSSEQDEARFEVCAHRFVDISEADWGIALLNDGKYGVDFCGGTVRLTCLKSPLYPDSTADRGTHRFSYALYPHRGNLPASKVIERAAEFNQPVHAFNMDDTKVGYENPRSFITIEGEGVFLEALKKAENGEGIVFRLVERQGRRRHVKVRLLDPPLKLWETNLMEDYEREWPVKNDGWEAEFTPFQARTFLAVW